MALVIDRRPEVLGPLLMGAVAVPRDHGGHEHDMTDPLAQPAHGGNDRGAPQGMADQDHLSGSGCVDLLDYGLPAPGEGHGLQGLRARSSSRQIDGQHGMLEVGDGQIPAAAVKPTAVHQDDRRPGHRLAASAAGPSATSASRRSIPRPCVLLPGRSGSLLKLSGCHR
jgi:hypothetical protein